MIIAGHLILDASDRDAYVDAHRDLVRRARAFDGCLHLAITADSLDPRRVDNVEVWESAERLDAWRQVADPPSIDAGPIDVEMRHFDAEDGGPLF